MKRLPITHIPKDLIKRIMPNPDDPYQEAPYQEAWKELREHLRKVCRKYLPVEIIEDVAQDVCRGLCKQIKKKSDKISGGYVAGILSNQIITAQGRLSRERKHFAESSELAYADSSAEDPIVQEPAPRNVVYDPEVAADSNEVMRICREIRESLHGTRRDQVDTAILHAYYGYTHEEIAWVKSQRMGTVKSNCSRGRRILEQGFRRKGYFL